MNAIHLFNAAIGRQIGIEFEPTEQFDAEAQELIIGYCADKGRPDIARLLREHFAAQKKKD